MGSEGWRKRRVEVSVQPYIAPALRFAGDPKEQWNQSYAVFPDP